MEPIENDSYYFFILTNENRTLLRTDIAGNLGIKLFHIEHLVIESDPLSACTNLVYWEKFEQALEALERQKQVEKLSNKKIIALINKKNPHWRSYNQLAYSR